MESLIEPPVLGGRLGSGVAWLHTRRGLQALRSAVWVLAVAGGLGFLIQGANRPADPHLSNQYLPGTGPPGAGPGGPAGSALP